MTTLISWWNNKATLLPDYFKWYSSSDLKELGLPSSPPLIHETFGTAVVTLRSGLKIDVATARTVDEFLTLPGEIPHSWIASGGRVFIAARGLEQA
jgi:hypothetical protein